VYATLLRPNIFLKVDGVPAQEGFWLLIPLVLPFVVSIVEGITKAVAK